MGYEHPNTTSEMESDEIIKSGVEELVPILSENEVTLEDKRECDVPVCENSPICDDHSKILSNSKNDDDISSNDDDFEDIKYVEASLSDPEIVSVEEENVVHQEEEEVDLEDISQIQDIVLREKLLSINRLIANIESLNDNPTPDPLIEECCVEVPEQQKQNMEKTMLDLVKICHHKQFLCIHDDVDNLIESALDSKLLSINSIKYQHLDKKEQEIKNVEKQPVELTPILSAKEPENSLSMGYEHLNITPETEYDEVTESNAKNLLPIPSECEVALEGKRECDLLISENSPVCDNSDTFFDSKIDDDISVYDESFEDIKYVDASVPDPVIVSVEEENVVHREEEEVDLEDISQVQDVVLREKLFSITRLISNIKSLNDKSTPDRVLNSFESDNSLFDNFSPVFKTFCDHSEETRSGNTTYANYSLPEYDSFCFEIEPDQERLINLMKNDISDSSNDPLLEETDLFLSNDSILPGIENVADDPEGDIRFLKELLIDDSILSHESSDPNNPSISRPPPEPPDVESFFDLKLDVIAEEISDKLNEDKCFDPGREINVSTKIEDDDYFPFMIVIRPVVSHWDGTFTVALIFAILSLNHFVEIPSGEIKVHIEVLSVL
nr:hypothetical protein [Tanacetum cinerariifolium]